MRSRYHVSVGDVRALALPALRHRVITNFYAESEQMTPDRVTERLLEAIPAPRSGM
jgi:MoxR-like ATPase